MPHYALAAELIAVVAGSSAIFYWVGCQVDNWYNDREQRTRDAEFKRQAAAGVVAEYVQEVTEQNEVLREEMAKSLSRELSWIEERKRLIKRLNMVCNELAYDDTKKTQVMEPEHLRHLKQK